MNWQCQSVWDHCPAVPSTDADISLLFSADKLAVYGWKSSYISLCTINPISIIEVIKSSESSCLLL